MLTAIKRRTDREDDGFTLIELMVVVLIIAILLAIAIPTFLGARDSANARAAQANLRNALTAEQTEWTNQQSFSGSNTTTGQAIMKNIEQGLNWVTTTPVTTQPNQVYAQVGDGASADLVVLQAQGKDNNCYYIMQSDNATTSYTAYGETTSSCTTFTAPSSIPAAPTSGSASSAPASASSGLPGTWYTSF